LKQAEPGNNMMGTPITGPQNELEENYYVYTGHYLIKFNVSNPEFNCYLG
jgi:hypothetical protein